MDAAAAQESAEIALAGLGVEDEVGVGADAGSGDGSRGGVADRGEVGGGF